jgi:tetratricopeptide (TPR) repeat protein
MLGRITEETVMDKFPEIDRLLVDRFARGNGTVFVGAGVSLASRLPTWKKLMAPLRDDLGPDADDLDALQVAELYEVKNGRSALVQYLKDQLGHVKFQLNKTHELLVSLPVQRIYTTNFDDLLEQASQKKQINRNVIYNASHVGLSDTSKLSIIKLHGDLADPASIVITARDFYSYAARNPAVADLLKVELQTRTVLFIGYSFNDPNLAMILGNAVTQAGGTPPLIYAIQFQPKELAVEAMKARGVTVIRIDARPGTVDAEKKVEDWLHQFRRSLNTFERRRQQALGARKLGTDGPCSGRSYSVKSERTFERIRNGLSSDFRVVVVKGEAGVGKTHLVVEAAMNRLQPNNRALWTEGFEQIVWIRPILRENGGYHSLEQIFSFITSQVDAGQVPGEDESERSRNRIDAILQERRLLIVIEDLDDPRADGGRGRHGRHEEILEQGFDEIKDWLEGATNYAYTRSRIVVTSRSATVAGFVVEVTRLGADDAAEMVHEHARALMLRRHFDALDDKVVEKIVDLTMGNPQAIRLALGLINGSADSSWLGGAIRRLRAHKNRHIEAVFDSITARIWAGLGTNEEARRVVETMAAFPAEEWVPSKLLENAARLDTDRHEAVQKCVRFGLIDYDAFHDRFFMHRTTKEALERGKLFDRLTLNEARSRLARYLLKFLGGQDVVCRPEISEPYWNALVRDEMVKIDPYWPIIESVMWWAESQRIIVDFLLLLVHYMDSRFLNGQRLHFVKQSIMVLDGSSPRIKALLHIDALGWTYIEEGSDADALTHIATGEKLLTGAGDDDLRALAWAWRARICARQGRIAEARDHIAKAGNHVASCPEKFWIKARVCMIAGDVKLMEKDPDAAEKLYLDAEANEERYGGEVGYQTDPRIGFALLRKADLQPARAREAIDAAKQRFSRLAENEHVPTGRLYGEYGLALITLRENSSAEARRQLKKILKEIAARQGENNVLLKLARESYDSLGKS